MEYNLRRLLPYVEQGCKIVCSEPSAALCLRDEMRLIIGTERANRVALNTVELMQYIKEILKQQTGRTALAKKPIGEYADTKYAYHAPCHLKSLRSEPVSIELMKQFGMDIRDINGGCCGLAGTAGMQKKHRDLSSAIGKPLVRAIADIGADIIVTECAACKMQIEHLTSKTVVHPAKILRRLLCCRP
jgi:glycerol-3-phosphate dehydrogenase subunit C